MKKMLVIGIMAVGLMAGSVNVKAASDMENDKFSFGRVVSVGADQLTIKEYDFAKDADVEVGYSVSAETEYGNVAALKDLAVSDDVVVDYVEKDGKRMITTLVKEEKGAEAPAALNDDADMKAAEGAAAAIPVEPAGMK